MTSIRETVVSALSNAGVSEYQQSSYSRQIDAVVEALEAQQTEQGYVLVENLVAAGQRLGLGLGRYEEELVSTIEQATGLTRRPAPEPEPEVSAEDLEAMLEGEGEEGGKKKGKGKKLDAILTQLQSIASKQAEQDEAINSLKGLAKSRLGVNL